MAFEYIKNCTSEDDYVERNGSVDELTVTITLCEYRGLIQSNAEQAAEIKRLRELCERIKQQAAEVAAE